MTDLRYSVRQLAKHPGFAAVAVLTLGLGIGANTAVFSLVHSLLFRTVSGVHDPDRLLAFDFQPGEKPTPLPFFSYPDFLEFPEGLEVFDGMAAWRQVSLTLGFGDQAERIQGLLVTPSWFGFLGVRLAASRGFYSENLRQMPEDTVVVISESLWLRRFNADPAVIGQTIRLK